jgi:hypothetical protein
MLADVPVGESPIGKRSVATVVIPDDEKGDRLAGSSGVKVPVGWVKSRSDPSGERATRQAAAISEPVQPRNHPPIGNGCWELREGRAFRLLAKANVIGEGTEQVQPMNSPRS